ncbi:hypothetical protein KBC75_04345 [Candidatus Shapirobacteria bacterium]|nr:hypothetical protein [Candidatus Shapirobacteria bacterium]
MPLPSQTPECPAKVCQDCSVYQLAQAEIQRRGLTTKQEIRTLAKWVSTNSCPLNVIWTDTLKPANVQQVG